MEEELEGGYPGGVEDLEGHIAANKKYYSAGILNPSYHARLVLDLERLSKLARVPEQYIINSMKTWCFDAEVAWLADFRQHKNSSDMRGLALFNISPFDKERKVSVDDHFLGIAGACIRNYIDARVFTLQEIIEMVKINALPECTVALVPNFFVASAGTIANWQISGLLGWLSTRYISGQYTVLYIEDKVKLPAAYGKAIANHLDAHFGFLDLAKY